MRNKLLLTIYRLCKANQWGRADIDECQKEFAQDEATFERLLLELDKLGYLSMTEVGVVGLSGYGLREAEQLEDDRGKPSLRRY
jgi:Mn-dependent DtxR family transcriptional regulator